jgi:two-component sensor histidine kinase
MTPYVVPHAPFSAATVRHELVIDLTAHEVPQDVVDDAALVMSELVGNAVRHGTPLQCGGVRVLWEVHDCALHLEVQDGGRGPAPDAPARQSMSAEGGRGLAIVEMLALRWGSTPTFDGGTGVYAELPLRAG